MKSPVLRLALSPWPRHLARMEPDDEQTFGDRIGQAQTDDELADVVLDMAAVGMSLDDLLALFPRH